ncbi:MAG: hypothetical protein RDU59_00305 [Thermodesulfobacteriota bacterium]|nr:hypothetical protein [Thermodesulfobacteriota bacterium]
MMIQLRDFETKLESRTFIDKAFNAFEGLLQSETGISNLRLRKDGCKGLIEEILPIATFLACFERPGLNLYCQYFPRNQKGSTTENFEAKVYCEGLLVEKGAMHNEYLVEVSIACHPNDYLKRECAEKGLPCFGGEIKRLPDGLRIYMIGTCGLLMSVLNILRMIIRKWLVKLTRLQKRYHSRRLLSDRRQIQKRNSFIAITW